MIKSRKEIAELISKRLQSQKEALKDQFSKYKDKIGYFYIDELLPKEITQEIYKKFPKLENTVSKNNIREQKYVAYQMNKFNPLLEEVIYAFQEQNVVDLISEICGINAVFPDDNLYAGGLSLMTKGNFLNPHLDNSHDKNRDLWRVLNLLFYVTPDWELESGGNLELWQEGVKKEPTIIESKFNRLVVMATHQRSWHSVNKVEREAVRCCVSNYYFSEAPLLSDDTFHVTSFRGRKNQKLKNLVLKADAILRNGVRKIFKKGLKENPHKYKK